MGAQEAVDGRDAEHSRRGLEDVKILTSSWMRQVPLRRDVPRSRGMSPARDAQRLGDLIDGKRPTLLTFAYFNCPVLCSLILNSAVSSLAKVPWTIGKEFDVITLSIDPHETSDREEGQEQATLLAAHRSTGRPRGDATRLGTSSWVTTRRSPA